VHIRDGERLLLLDAGTGVRRLLTSPDLVQGVSRIDILLSHFHVDHIIGLSYLPGLAAQAECVVWGPGRALYGTATVDLLRRILGRPLFALEVDEFLAVKEFQIREFELGPFQLAVRAQEKHTQPSVAFRIGDDLTYCTDTGYDHENVSFAAGCRHLVHEAFYLHDAPDATHATPEEAARIAAAADVSRLTLVHLHPQLEDDARLLIRARAVFGPAEAGRDLTILK
jgi:ribonuclease BN (tRNA processing enzyme)